MKPVLAALRTLAVLAACLAVLGAAAWLVGELPPRDVVAMRRRADDERARAERADAAVQAAAEAARTAALDAGVDASVPEPPRTGRHRICDEAQTASLTRARLDARGRELLAIGCGDALDVLGFVDDVPVLVAKLVPSAPDQAAPVRRFTLLSEDVTGDGMIDWLVGTSRSVDLAAPAVGSLHLVPGDGRGGLGDAQLLAPLAVATLDVGRADDDAIADLVVLHRPDSVGSRAPEAWVFRGGASIVRTSRTTMANDVVGVSLVDLDADGKSDLFPVSATSATVRAFAGDGAGAFTRPIEVSSVAADGFLRATLAATGARILLTGATPSFLVPAAPAPTVRPYALPASPIAGDVHADAEHQALRIAWLAEGSVGYYDGASDTPRRMAAVTLPPTDGRIVDVALGDFSGGPSLDLVLLVERSGAAIERDLVLLPDLEEGDRSLHLAPTRSAVSRGPLHLTIPLR